MTSDEEETIDSRARPPGLWLVYAAFVLWLAWIRSDGLAPPALGQDDLWVGFLVKHSTWSDLFTYTAPVPMGFVAAQKLVAPWFANVEVGLQILPFACSLALVPLAGWAGTRLTGRWEIGLLAAVLVAIHPRGMAYSVRVKQFSWDAMLSLALAGYGLPHLLRTNSPARSPWTLAAAGAGALLLSFNSIFVGFALCHVGILHAWPDPERRRAALGAALLYDAVAVALYLFRLQDQSADWILTYWERRAAFPLEEAGWDLKWLRDASTVAFGRWLRARWATEAFVAPVVGLIGLAVARRSRLQALALMAIFLAIPLAGLLRLYPFGGIRTDFYFQPLLAITAAAGAATVTQLIAWGVSRATGSRSGRRMLEAATSLLLAMGLLVSAPWHPGMYGWGTMTTELRDLVGVMEDYSQPEDLILITRPSRWNVGFYTELEVEPSFVGVQSKLFDYTTASPRGQVVQSIGRDIEAANRPERITLVALLEGKKRLAVFRRVFRRAGYRLEMQRLARRDGSAVMGFVRQP